MGASRLSSLVWLLALATPAVGAPPSKAALEVMARHQCHRCHEVEGLRPPPMKTACAGCHQQTAAAAGDPKELAAGKRKYGEVFDRFVSRTGGLYVNVPALDGMDRFRSAWLTDFLQAPYDLRPNLTESMIRHALTPAEAAALVRGWGARDEPAAQGAPAPGRLEEGARLFEASGCATCHLLGGRPFASAAGFQFERAPRVRHRALAPDLQHARDRLTRAAVLRYLEDPKAQNPKAEMPKLPLDAAARELLADFVLFAEPAPIISRAAPAPPPFDPEGEVPAWEEVERAVFRHTCWHCHAEPAFNHGDGGPGNTGGLGFRGARVSFFDYASLLRSGVLRPGASGEAVLLERLRRRYEENARDHVAPGEAPAPRALAPAADAARGMPLGLPALSAEQFSLVERWVKGGAPGPGE